MKASKVTFILILSVGISSKQAKHSKLFGSVGNVSVCQSVCVLSGCLCVYGLSVSLSVMSLSVMSMSVSLIVRKCVSDVCFLGCLDGW